jgi:GNAT superfamily N-acetyltransferase
MRLAFGTFIGLPDPMAFMGNANYVRTRWLANPANAFAAEVGGELVGSNFATNWGSVGFFGPLTVHPDYQDRGIGRRLMEPVMDCFDRWGTRHAGLFTWAQSPKHVGLYQSCGFWARYLTAITERPVPSVTGSSPPTISSTSESERAARIDDCREVAGTVYQGLDLSAEVHAVEAQALGDTVLLYEDSNLVGFAICHCGPGTEAGPDTCFIKFAAVRPGSHAAEQYERLLDACDAFAADRGLSRVVAGTNMARQDAYRRLITRGFRTWLQGVTMHRPNEPGYSHGDAYVLDDWR